MKAKKRVCALCLTSILAALPAVATEKHRIAVVDNYLGSGALHSLGYEEGKNVIIKTFQSSPLIDRHLPQVITEAIEWNPDLIVTSYADATRAVIEATSDIPIVAMTMVDPVSAGFVASTAKPGGNVSGVVLPHWALFDKKFILLKELLPELERVGLIFDPGTEYGLAAWEKGKSIAAGHALDLEPVALDVDSDVVPALQAALDTNCGAFLLMLLGSAGLQHGPEINEFTVAHKLPVVYPSAGLFDFRGIRGIMSLGPVWSDVDFELAYLIDQILKGANPASLPIRHNDSSELVLVPDVAEQMGLEIPKSILARTNRVIHH